MMLLCTAFFTVVTLSWTRSATAEIDLSSLPTEVDWRTKGVLPPVINQGDMGCSTTFTATEAIESYHAIRSGQLLSLSYAEVASCCSRNCTLTGAGIFDCIAKIGGLCSESAYPRITEQCESSRCETVAAIKGGVAVPTGNEQALAEAVARQPVVAAIDVTRTFMDYKSGVLEDFLCSKSITKLNHLVLVVGYGTDSKGVEYWIVQNSWGKEWGTNGFLLMARNRNNMCGIATDASYPM